MRIVTSHPNATPTWKNLCGRPCLAYACLVTRNKNRAITLYFDRIERNKLSEKQRGRICFTYDLRLYNSYSYDIK